VVKNMLCMQEGSSRADVVFVVCTDIRAIIVDKEDKIRSSLVVVEMVTVLVIIVLVEVILVVTGSFRVSVTTVRKKGIEFRIAIRRKRTKPVKLRQ
jgi:hypothetical protein